jgi:hypothetical protein
MVLIGSLGTARVPALLDRQKQKQSRIHSDGSILFRLLAAVRCDVSLISEV